MNAPEASLLQQVLHPALPWLYASTYWWSAVGFAANLLFGSRFVFQWLASEKKHQIVVPPYFWHLSFWGSVLNLLYVIHLDSMPLILGTLFLPFIYGRNLVLMRKNKKKPAESRRQDASAMSVRYGKPAEVHV
ncbi:MAG: lipid-A-disaccharide synthase N-terminal domain-containing protein [Verrucomicrobiota bacterium]|nr:lipid-A-disaccharide synthase N-terminal domain-containing protein [Verrucomicrobiota bacterium]